MVIGPCGYGRYNDDLNHVGCPRAGSDMSPCIARDGKVALDDSGVCVYCGESPHDLLRVLKATVGSTAVRPGNPADLLRDLVWEVTKS